VGSCAMQEAYNDALYFKDEALRAFKLGILSLEERAQVRAVLVDRPASMRPRYRVRLETCYLRARGRPSTHQTSHSNHHAVAPNLRVRAPLWVRLRITLLTSVRHLGTCHSSSPLQTTTGPVSAADHDAAMTCAGGSAVRLHLRPHPCGRRRQEDPAARRADALRHAAAGHVPRELFRCSSDALVALSSRMLQGADCVASSTLQ